MTYALLALFLWAPHAEAAKFFKKNVSPGVVYEHHVYSDPPRHIYLLRVDLYYFGHEVRPVLAWDRIGRAETVSSMARRYSAIAGINGSFFDRASGRWYPVGYIVSDYKLIYSSRVYRAVFGLTTVRDPVFGYFRPAIIAYLHRKDYRIPVGFLNRPAPPDGIVLYTGHYGTTTRNYAGREFVLERVAGDTYQVRHTLPANAPIPKDGLVLSFFGSSLRAAGWIRTGDLVDVNIYMPPELSDVQELITGGPYLVREGKNHVQAAVKLEGFYGGMLGRHPRSAVGVTKDNQLLLTVVDGRNPKWSVGMTFSEMADYLIRVGASEAIGLDSGGSSTLVVKGSVVNRPSDGAERGVANGILVVKR